MVSSDRESMVPTQPIPAKSLAIKTDKPRPYVCAACTRSFVRLEHLKRHERSHTKEKPFECPVCDRSFARRDLLLRHKQKLHANFSPGDTSKRNSISGPCSRGRRANSISTFSPGFSPGFSPSFSPPPAGNNPLNPLEHELMAPSGVAFSRSQSFSAVSADSYMPDSAGYRNEFEDTVNPQMLRQGQPPQFPPGASGPQQIPFPGQVQVQQPVHMGIRRKHRFNSNASAKPFIDSPDYSIASSSLSQFDSPSTVPYQSPPTDLSRGTPQAQQHHWSQEMAPHGLLPHMGMVGFEQSDDFVNNLLNLEGRFDIKKTADVYENVAPDAPVPPHAGDEWFNGEAPGHTPQDSIRGFSSSFTSSLLRFEDQVLTPAHHRVGPMGMETPYNQPLQSFMQQTHAANMSPRRGSIGEIPPHTVAPAPIYGETSPGPGHAHGVQAAPAAPSNVSFQNLPSSQEVRRLVSAFYTNFNTPAHFVQNGPDLASQNMALVMSMAALGALYLEEIQTAHQIFELSRDCIRMFSDLNSISLGPEPETPKEVPIWLVQASMLSLYYLMYTSNTTNYEQIANQAANLATLAHRAKLHLKPSQVLDVPARNASLEERFKFHVAAERRVRTMYAVYIATSYCTSCFSSTVYCNATDLECGTPRPDELVMAESADKWWSDPRVRKLPIDTEPFSKHLDSLNDGKVLGSFTSPTVLLSLICALVQQFGADDGYSSEQKSKIITTWESSWSNSKYASAAEEDKNRAILSDCVPTASLAMMRIRITPPIHLSASRGDFQTLNSELDTLRITHPEDLVDAAVYALDAFVSTDEMNRKKSKLFFPAVIYLLEAAITLSEALAIIEAMPQPVEKHQRLLMRAHKILSQLTESETYAFASEALFNIQNPQTSLSSMVLRVAIVLFQCNNSVPFLPVEILKARLDA